MSASFIICVRIILHDLFRSELAPSFTLPMSFRDLRCVNVYIVPLSYMMCLGVFTVLRVRIYNKYKNRRKRVGYFEEGHLLLISNKENITSPANRLVDR